MKKERSLTGPVDGHAHLDGIADPEEALCEAGNSGVHAVIGVGMNLESNRKILSIARAHRGFVFPAIGYHPWDIRKEEVDETLAFIEEHCGEAVALGEVGLDYKVKVKKSLQKEVFNRIVGLASRSGMPLILHSRLSYERVFSTVAKHHVERAVFHWYSGPADILENLLEAGYYVSATPALAYSEPHRRAIERAPLGQILLETDCPVNYGQRDSRPSDVFVTLDHVSRIKGCDPAEVAAVTTASARAFFALDSWAT